MDASRFDSLTRALSEAGSRRGLLVLIAGLPLVGGLAALLANDDDTEAKNRRKKRKKPHKRAKRRRKRQHNRRRCKAHARKKACSGKCGKVKNNCGKTITCGGCAAEQICDKGRCRDCDVLAGDDLAAAVTAAGDGDTLYVCPGTYAGEITIANNITLVGAGQGTDGTIVEGGTFSFFVDGGTKAQPVTLRGLRIQSGDTGIVLNESRRLVVTDCTVRDHGPNPGAGVINNGLGGKLEMTRCTIEDNQTANANWGGGLFNVRGPATLTNCLVRRNIALQGGGIWNGADGADLILKNTLVTDNEATEGDGSGILNVAGGTVKLQRGSTICANDPTDGQCSGFTAPAGACPATCPGS
jgi:hypothetical protein